MSFNWNVYKLFKSGKRAKAPVHSFFFDGTLEEAYDRFVGSEIKQLGDKANQTKYHILNSETDQERVLESDESEKISIEKNRVLGAIMRKIELPTARSYATALVYTRESNWKWQWAAIQPGTGKYIAGLSEEFKTHGAAEEWMNSQIATTYTGK